MPRPLEPIDPDGGPVAEFAQQLRERMELAGMTLTETATRIQYDRSSVSKALGGKIVASWSLTERMLKEWGEDSESWMPRWKVARAAARSAGTQHPLPPAPRIGPTPPPPAELPLSSPEPPPPHSADPPRLARKPVIAVISLGAAGVAAALTIWHFSTITTPTQQYVPPGCRAQIVGGDLYNTIDEYSQPSYSSGLVVKSFHAGDFVSIRDARQTGFVQIDDGGWVDESFVKSISSCP